MTKIDFSMVRSIGGVFFFTALVGTLALSCKQVQTTKNQEDADAKVSNVKFGLDLEHYQVIENEFRWGDSFSDLMAKHDFSHAEIHQIVSNTKDSIDYSRDFKVGNPFSIFISNDSLQRPEYFVYHPPKATSYTLIKLQDSVYGEKIPRKITYVERESSGIIESSLDQTILDAEIPYGLSNSLESIYAWTIDFFHLHKGDRFKVMYVEEILDDSISIGIKEVKAALFEHRGRPLYAFRHTADPRFGPEYFDEEGNNLRRQFLTAPVARSRITSRYNLKRRIALYNYQVRPHKGTDFAAPLGSPIMSTANGTVERVGYTSANGKYVKIRHNSIYSTQYLHMDRIDVKKGQFVKQGQTIGTVGMTGYTSGPHVCYRFWKKGVQVDPFKEDLPSIDPMEETERLAYVEKITSAKSQLDLIHFQSIESHTDDTELVQKSDINKTHDSSQSSP
ncbi:MAG: peptidoglycan DD-metalloendopeptidase family protein [Flavobacteriaceae bacterium]|nr:peptidoglycan DD-metalloendopeptidase family protein [Flavobacteriaceae bacterium]MCY4216951.1 peptidoglycan DD-metalloendopeptidase family protein [Flavobacteriaceae bacterium]MCY4253621.1 peptidoglycan DD-metalloendopeptidase family protein [Flavobacteriaceae bacterium]